MKQEVYATHNCMRSRLLNVTTDFPVQIIFSRIVMLNKYSPWTITFQLCALFNLPTEVIFV